MKTKVMLVAILLLSGCSTVTYTLTDTREAMEPTFTGSNAFFIGGIGQEKKYAINEMCGKRGADSIKTYYTFIDGLVAAVTLGIYTPNTYAIYCHREH